MKTRSRILLAALAGASLVYQVPAMAERSQDAADMIQAGQSREEVVQQLGEPDSTRTIWSPSAPSLPVRHADALVYEVAPKPGNDDAYLIVELDETGAVSKSYIMTEDND